MSLRLLFPLIFGMGRALTWQTKKTENISMGLYFLRHSSWLINSGSICYYAAEKTSRSCLSLLCNCVGRYSVKKNKRKEKRRKIRFSCVLFCTFTFVNCCICQLKINSMHIG